MPERIRTFIAIELPLEVQRGLARVQEHLKRGHPPVRWVAPAKIHVTLKFLGEIPADEVQRVIDATVGVAAGSAPFALEAMGVGCFPNLRRPRVVWIGVEGDLSPLQDLQSRLGQELAALGFPPEGRPFSPHLTVGRVRRQARPGETRALGQAVGALAVPSLGRWRVEKIVVMRSDLRPEGPLYTPLRLVPLGRK